MQAIVIDPQAPMRLGFQTVEAPLPQANEAVIRVKESATVGKAVALFFV
jgi:hypothetical protein